METYADQLAERGRITEECLAECERALRRAYALLEFDRIQAELKRGTHEPTAEHP